ncbi:MAG: RluA family pseudouridine synthase [Planctomycetes bacterium]|nr:RluA family pseudouridine synthase [Planctomycetota bacterium]
MPPAKKIEIIHQDENIVVVNKPSGISVTKDRSGNPDLIPVLAKQLPDVAKLLLVHRLDKDTSGVMILAKNTETQSLYSSGFEKRLFKKTYLALVNGAMIHNSGCIKTPISRSRKNPKVMVADPKHGKPAITDWKLLADFGMIALLAVSPVTGRTHQIRIHMSNVHMPLAIDPLYSSTRPILLSDFKAKYKVRRGREEKPLIERLTLHAYQIEVPDEGGLQAGRYIAPLDKKFAATIKMLTKHNAEGEEAFLDPAFFDAIIKSKPI